MSELSCVDHVHHLSLFCSCELGKQWLKKKHGDAQCKRVFNASSFEHHTQQAFKNKKLSNLLLSRRAHMEHSWRWSNRRVQKANLFHPPMLWLASKHRTLKCKKETTTISSHCVRCCHDVKLMHWQVSTTRNRSWTTLHFCFAQIEIVSSSWWRGFLKGLLLRRWREIDWFRRIANCRN